jgi:hypothetical protein
MRSEFRAAAGELPDHGGGENLLDQCFVNT